MTQLKREKSELFPLVCASFFIALGVWKTNLRPTANSKQFWSPKYTLPSQEKTHGVKKSTSYKMRVNLFTAKWVKKYSVWRPPGQTLKTFVRKQAQSATLRFNCRFETEKWKQYGNVVFISAMFWNRIKTQRAERLFCLLGKNAKYIFNYVLGLDNESIFHTEK